MSNKSESMFTSRKPVWSEIGHKVERSLSLKHILKAGGLDWTVKQKPVYVAGKLIPNQKANIRDSDGEILGIVGDRYKVIQNSEAFSFVDTLLDEGITIEAAGSLQNGRRCFMLAKLPDRYMLNDERIDPYLCICNSHDGSLALSIFMMPIRILCMNHLNFALKQSKRSWSIKHTGNMQDKLREAHGITALSANYMTELCKEINVLNRIKMPEAKVISYIDELTPLPANATDIQKKNVKSVRDDITTRYFEAPDLKILDKNAYRFINAISDHATHASPLRATANYQENLFMRTMDGNPLIDKAYTLIKAAS